MKTALRSVSLALLITACSSSSSTGDDALGQTGGGAGGASGSTAGGASGASAGGAGGEGGGGGGHGGGATSRALCDGSDDLRLAMTTGGGFVDSTYTFTNPYGFQFAFIDGTCRYWVGRGFREGVRTGVLDTEARGLLASELGYQELPAWGTHTDESCPDAGSTVLSDGVNAASCSCGCDDDAPDGLADSIAAFDGWIDQLWGAGTASSGAVSILVWPWPEDTTVPVQAWPLDIDLGTLAVEEPWNEEAGTLIDDAEDAEALRLLREEGSSVLVYGDGSLCVEAATGERYHMLVRDELPAEIAVQADTFVP